MNYRTLSSLLHSSAPLWCTFAIFQLVDAAAYPLLHAPVKHFHPAGYMISCLMSLLSIAWLWLLYNMLPTGGRRIAAVVMGFALAFLAMANVLVYRQMGEYLSVYMLSFIRSDSSYLSNFAKDYLFNISMLWFVLLWVLFTAVWFPRTPQPRTKRRTVYSIAGAMVLPVLYLVPLNYVNLHGRQAILTSPAATGLAVRDYLRIADMPPELSASPHLAVQSTPEMANRDFNVIVIVNESWGQHGLPFYGSRDTAMPFLTKWVADNSDCFFVFQRAYTNSNATNVSVPSIMTGVGPEEHCKKLHSMPFLWDWARAADMSTMLVSAQRFSWARFDRFFFSPGLQVRITAEQMDMPQINDTGVDELYASDQFCKAIDNLPKDKRFLAVYNSNAMHMPFQQTSDFISEKPPFSLPYYNAAWLLDKSFRRIYETLKKNGDLERTLIVFTSDHGEYNTVDCHSCTPRIAAFNKTIMNIPFLVFAPKAWASSRAQAMAALRANCSRPVANIDIAPTLADVLNIAAHNRTIVSEFEGYSFAGSIPNGRAVLSLNTNDLRHWDQEGFSIYTDTYHFAFSNSTGSEYFDIVSDPHESTNIWAGLAPAKRNDVMKHIDSTAHLKRVYTKFASAQR